MTLDSIAITVTQPRVIDGFIAAANKIGITPEEMINEMITQRGLYHADNNNIGVITSAAFVSRFTPTEYGAIMTAAEYNTDVAALIGELTASPQVALDDPRLAPGLALLVSEGLVDADRVDTLLSYERPSVITPPEGEN